MEKPCESFRYGPFQLDADTGQVKRDGSGVPLSRRESDLLRCMMHHPGQVLDRETILREVWGTEFGGEAGIVDVYMHFLREKIDENHLYLRTIRGFGYMFVP